MYVVISYRRIRLLLYLRHAYHFRHNGSPYFVIDDYIRVQFFCPIYFFFAFFWDLPHLHFQQRVSLCFRYLYIADNLWNYIQASLGSLCLELLLLNFDILLTPCGKRLFRFHACSPFHWHAWWIGVNTWGVKLFRIPLSPHKNLTALITFCNCSKRELLFKGRSWPPSILSAATIKDSLSLII